MPLISLLACCSLRSRTKNSSRHTPMHTPHHVFLPFLAHNLTISNTFTPEYKTSPESRAQATLGGESGTASIGGVPHTLAHAACCAEKDLIFKHPHCGQPGSAATGEVLTFSDEDLCPCREKGPLCYSEDTVLHSLLNHGDKPTHPCGNPLEGITISESNKSTVCHGGPHQVLMERSSHGVELRRSSNAEVLTDQYMRGETGREGGAVRRARLDAASKEGLVLGLGAGRPHYCREGRQTRAAKNTHATTK